MHRFALVWLTGRAPARHSPSERLKEFAFAVELEGGISVKPTSAIFAYANRNTDPIAAGHELDVDMVMQGTVQKMGEQVRLTIRVIRVDDGKPVWANHFDARGTDRFAIQDELSEQVMEEITRKLAASE